MKTRRDFLKQSGLAAAGIAVGGIVSPAHATALSRLHAGADRMPADDRVRALMMTALDAARGAGASYADVRIGRYRNGYVGTRERGTARARSAHAASFDCSKASAPSPSAARQSSSRRKSRTV